MQKRHHGSKLAGAVSLALCVAAIGCAQLSGYERIVETRVAQPGAFTVVKAVCSPGKRVLGGGFHGISSSDIQVSQQFPQDTTDAGGNAEVSWQVGVTNSSGFPTNVTAYALCAD